MASPDRKVLISYTHDSPEHERRVLELSDRLLQNGVDCHIDQYETSPPEGWPRWMRNQVADADFVLVVCTKTYQRRFDGHEMPGKGLGAQWEGDIITQELYDGASRNTKFIPILFSEKDAENIPRILRGSTYYRVDREEGFEDLYRRLTAQPKAKKPPLGKRRVLEPINTGSHPTAAPSAAPREQTASSGAITSTTMSREKNLSNLALLYLSDGRFAFLPAARIEQGELLQLELLPDEARKTAFLSDLNDRYHRPEIAVAFRNTAVTGELLKATTVHDENSEIWQLQIKPSTDNYYSPLGDFTVNNYTPEDIAELRARLILLDEQPQRVHGRDRLTEGLSESMINSSEGFIKQVISPFPTLYRLYPDDTEYFLKATQLMCTLFLKLTGTVEHIFKLELKMRSDGIVEVEFEGQRRARYANQSPHLISINGSCQLQN